MHKWWRLFTIEILPEKHAYLVDNQTATIKYGQNPAAVAKKMSCADH